MRTSDMAKGRRARPRMSALRSDTSANTLAMMAIALIPLSALVGSGVDTARTYVVKTRLQQACDAGVLAGRKFMEIGAGALDSKATTQAQSFFRNNFTTGWLGTSNVSFTPTKTDGQQVSGTASAVVPMTIMKMFDANDLTVSVTCEARYDVADSDIMFVLDVTGSMACTPQQSNTNCAAAGNIVNQRYFENGEARYAATEHNGSRMQALREAVIAFDQTVKSSADPSTTIRYGFAPYSSSVNVGALIPSAHMVTDNWTYQSRTPSGEKDVPGETSAYSNTSVALGEPCKNAASRTPATGYAADETAIRVDTRENSGRCQRRTRKVEPQWAFQPVQYDISAYVRTLTNGGTVQDPSRWLATPTRWNGCIEERVTTTATSFNIDALPADLNPDLIPNSNDTRWKPAWPSVIWYRDNNGAGVLLGGKDEAIQRGTYNQYGQQLTPDFPSYTHAYQDSSSRWQGRAPGGFSACPPAARRLAVMSAAEVSAYVNSNTFRPHGGTYHDIGMIWGTRMLSPNGVFRADTAPSTGRPAPRRHIIFMTDGFLAPSADSYTVYGIQRYDNRVGGGIGNASMLQRHNARFLAVCQYARDRLNMTVWVVALSSGLNDDMRACATPGDHAFTASSKTELETAFRRIAQQVAMLRVSK